jgi:hypothetical protein
MPDVDPKIAELCGSVEAPQMMRHLEEFARRVKLSGTNGELESFAYLETQLKGYGLRTELILHDAYVSLPGSARLIVDGASPHCITHSFSQTSALDGSKGRLVYAGSGTADELAAVNCAGAILLLEGIATPAASSRASQAGAVGQIHISPNEHLYEMCISPVWGSPTPQQLQTTSSAA